MSVAMSASSSSQSHKSTSSTSSSSSHYYSSSSSSSSSSHNPYSQARYSQTASSHYYTRPDANAADWSQPFEVDDSDITFDGEPLSALFEKEHRSYAKGGGEKERGRKKKRDAH